MATRYQIEQEIKDLEHDIEIGQDAWEQGDDPFAMASCDPSDWYVKGRRIDELKELLKSMPLD